MTYNWRGEFTTLPYSREWFDEIDQVHILAARLFATERQPFDRILPLERLAGKHVLEIGCGMGLHTETMARAGALVTAIDLTRTGVVGTKRRLELKALDARVLHADAEELPFKANSFDFVWSWGVIHHSARTAKIVREISRVLTRCGESRVMVYNREGMSARLAFLKDHLLRFGFFHRTFDETLYRSSDGFTARFFVREHFEDLFRAFFSDVSSEICGLDVDALPLPRALRRFGLHVVPDSYLRAAQARRGGFILLKALNPT